MSASGKRWWRWPGIRGLSIKAKLMVMLMTVAVGVGGVMSLAFAAYDYVTMRDDNFNNLAGLATMAGANSAGAIAFNDTQTAQEILDAFESKPWVSEAWLHLPDGSILAAYVRDDDRRCSFFFRDPGPMPLETSRVLDKGRAYLTQPVKMDGEVIAAIHLVSDLSGLYADLRERLAMAIGIMLLSLAGAMLLAALLQNMVSTPILHLTQTMAAVKNDQNYALRAEMETNDELGLLVEGFNEMISTIEQHAAEHSDYREQLEVEVAKRTENLEVAIREAQQANHAKSQFLANMSHEVRTPVNGVSGMLQLLQGTGPDNRQQLYIKTASTAVDTLLKVINDILDFSKADAGKMELDAVDFNLRKLTEDLLHLFAEAVDRKGLDLACIIDPEVPMQLRGDDRRIKQVLMNLLGNAIKFTHRGDVLLRIGMASVDTDQVKLSFTLSDTGIGIPAEQQPGLFRPFSQADGSMTRQYGGTGLGLAICSQLVELMGGEIGVESAEGMGSTFWFTVRLDQPLQDEVEVPRKLPDMRVLVVDEDGMGRSLICRQLASWGCTPAVADNASQADTTLQEAQAAGEPFDVALIDEGLPGTSGSKLIEQIGRDPSLGHTRLVLLCPVLRQTAAHGGVQLQKPARQSELYNVLVGFLEPASLPTAPVPVNTNPDIRILVAEDNDINQMVVAEMLNVFGYQYDCVENGEDAVAAVQRGIYDLVLMDCQMPVLDGYEATRIIRKQEADKNWDRIPIVALTAHALKGDRDMCFSAGMDDYLTKPLDQGRFLECLSRWAGEKDGSPA